MRRVIKLAVPKHRWLLLHDNAPAHCTLNVMQFLASKSICVIQLPPYSPDLAPADFILFPKVKLALKAQRFSDIRETQHGVTKLLTGVPFEEFERAFEDLYKRSQHCAKLGTIILEVCNKNLFLFVINAVYYIPGNVYYI
jgi:transposase